MTIVSLEHDPVWHQRVRNELTRFGLDATVAFAPLRRFNGYAWYDTSAVDLPEKIDLVACDGPPGDGETLGGRIGMLPELRQRLRAGCLILLDDLDRDEERLVLSQWATALGTDYQIIGQRVGVLTVPTA